MLIDNVLIIRYSCKVLRDYVPIMCDAARWICTMVRGNGKHMLFNALKLSILRQHCTAKYLFCDGNAIVKLCICTMVQFSVYA